MALTMKYASWYCVLIFFLVSCGSKDEAAADTTGNDLGIKTAEERLTANKALLADAKTIIKDGDLILRTGVDFSSNHIRELSLKEKVYSHGGIALRDSATGELEICHVVTDFLHVRDKVRKESLDSFCNPSENAGFAVARYNFTPDELSKFKGYLEMQYKNHVPFDMRFDITTDDSMYCSEMIKKGLMEATNNRIHIENSRFYDRSKYKVVKQYLKLTEKEYIGRLFVPVDHLYLRPDCQVVKRYVFE